MRPPGAQAADAAAPAVEGTAEPAAVRRADAVRVTALRVPDQPASPPPASRALRRRCWASTCPAPFPGRPHLIGGTETLLHEAGVDLACAGYEWQATVSFCIPGFAGFGLAGLRGFFDKIHVGVDGYLQVVHLEPHDDRLERLGLDSPGRPSRRPRTP